MTCALRSWWNIPHDISSYGRSGGLRFRLKQLSKKYKTKQTKKKQFLPQELPTVTLVQFEHWKNIMAPMILKNTWGTPVKYVLYHQKEDLKFIKGS